MPNPQLFLLRQVVKHSVSGTRRVARRKASDAVRPVTERRSRARAVPLLLIGAAIGAVAAWPAARRRGAATPARGGWTPSATPDRLDDAVAAVQERAASPGSPASAAPSAADDDVLAAAVTEAIGAEAHGVTVESDHAVIHLRGEVAGADVIATLVRQAEQVPGVKAVQSLLHMAATTD